MGATPSLDRAILATAFPYDQRKRCNFYLTFWEAFIGTILAGVGGGVRHVLAYDSRLGDPQSERHSPPFLVP